MREGKHNSLMPPLLDFWFDFASTYSYPAAMQSRLSPWRSEQGAGKARLASQDEL
jgi:2-hydroxychromene-2-carboxylate isomerase